MQHFTLKHVSATGTGGFVAEDHFGANALHSVNTDSSSDHAPKQGYQSAVSDLQITNLRYPGGHVENTLDVTHMPDGALREEVTTFLDWCRDNSNEMQSIDVTFVLPTKTDIPAAQMEAFVYALLENYGDVIVALEIGNEYSIGARVPDADRSLHPEHIAGTDFISSQNELEYSIAANRVINACQDAIDRLHADTGYTSVDPIILLQMAETNGAGSTYKGGEDAGNYDAANEAILSLLNERAIEAVDAAVVHYYHNVDRDDGLNFEEADDMRESRRIAQRFNNFESQIDKEIDLFVTEWNVGAKNITQHGAASASVLLEMFEIMIQMGVDDAHVWPLQHRTPNTLMGNRDAAVPTASMGGAAFEMMLESLRPRESETGRADQFESLFSDWSDTSGTFEVNHYASDYRDVIFVSLRDEVPASLELNLGDLVSSDGRVSVERLTIDPTSSDGLSDLADENGLNRLPRRTISQDELDDLETLAFFDPQNANHVKVVNGSILTYLPQFETIIPIVETPMTIDDYYFTSEIDVVPLRLQVAHDDTPGRLAVDMMPFDVLRVVIDDVATLEDTALSNTLLGGVGRDVILGREGNDTLFGGEDADTLKGGWGDDSLIGGDGDDSLVDGHGNDVLNGGDGNDALIATKGKNTLLGRLGDDFLSGGEGDDIMRAGGGSDTVEGGAGNDLLVGNGQTDLLSGGAGDDILRGGNGRDTLSGDDGADELRGGKSKDRLFGGGDNDILVGNAGNDSLYGGSGNDNLSGGGDDDWMDGGAGDDFLKGGAGSDTFYFGRHGGHDVIRDFDPDVDTLLLSADLMAAGITEATEAAAAYGNVIDGDVALEFGDGDILLIAGVQSIEGIGDFLVIQ